jgi:hypothetical protein
MFGKICTICFHFVQVYFINFEYAYCNPTEMERQEEMTELRRIVKLAEEGIYE